jgi:c-di-GMP phosphodiesterase
MVIAGKPVKDITGALCGPSIAHGLAGTLPRTQNMATVAELSSSAPSGAPNALPDVFVARQPIYDTGLKVAAYEVLFRNSRENKAIIDDPDQATSQLLLNLMVEIGIDHIVGDRPAYLNMTRSFLTGKMPIPLEPGRIVLEVLEQIEVDDELVDGVRTLSELGFKIALDDAVFHPRLKPLLELADIVKVELPAIPGPELASHVMRFRHYKAQLLAEKVETIEEFEHCKRLGFDLFQGYFLSRPQMVQGKSSGSNRAGVLRVLSVLSNPDVKTESIEQVVRQDAVLSYKLLRYINSSKFALRRKIESIRDAIMLLGLHGVRTLAMLISVSTVSNKPPEVLLNAMMRAILCEKLAEKIRDTRKSTFFTAGLLSSLDAVLDMPLADVLKALPLTDDLKQAILTHENQVGLALKCAQAYERAEWNNVEGFGLSPAELRSAYLESLTEACAMYSSVSV